MFITHIISVLYINKRGWLAHHGMDYALTLVGCRKGYESSMLYRCLVKNGHCGSGRYTERSVFVRAKSTAEAMHKAKRYKGVKKGRFLRSGASVLAVERAEMQ